MYEMELRILIEVASAVICFILVWFMVKPYLLTREGRYLGLPLGFGFLGISYLFSGMAMSIPGYFDSGMAWLQLLPRAFAFIFLAVAYYFSKEPSKNSRIFWDMTISLLIVALSASIIVAFIVPQYFSGSYRIAATFVRFLNLICLTYISIHVLRSHINSPDPTTIWIPMGFFLLGVSQYLLVIWGVDGSLFAFWSALVLRLIALSVFLIVTYQTFLQTKKRMYK
jgi:hypothetical protein